MRRMPEDVIGAYLDRLEHELSDLPYSARREVLDEISAHIADMRVDLSADSEAEIRTLLDRVGDPSEIAAEARDRFDVQHHRRSRLDVAAVVFLSIGSLVLPIVGWFVGVVLLWISEAWNTRDKVLGTLFVPGGLGTALLLLQTAGFSQGCAETFDEQGRSVSRTCSGGTSTFEDVFWPALLIAIVVASVATTIYLAVRLRRSTSRAVFA